MTTLDIAWMAGLLEGEGCFLFQDPEKRRYPRIALDLTDRDVIDRFAALAGVNVSTRAPNKVAHYKTVYYVRVGGPTALGLMMTLFPLMGARRRAKIKKCIEIWKTRPDRRPSGMVARWGLTRLCRNGKHTLTGRGCCQECYALSAGISSSHRAAARQAAASRELHPVTSWQPAP